MFKIPIKPNYEGLLRNLRREGTPERVYHLELFLDHGDELALVYFQRYTVKRSISNCSCFICLYDIT